MRSSVHAAHHGVERGDDGVGHRLDARRAGIVAGDAALFGVAGVNQKRLAFRGHEQRAAAAGGLAALRPLADAIGDPLAARVVVFGRDESGIGAGVGRLLIQMAKRAGAYVLTTVSTEDKAEIARAAGADERKIERKELLAAIKQKQANNPEQAVVIAADKDVKYEAVLKVMDELQRADVRRVGLLVKPAAR